MPHWRPRHKFAVRRLCARRACSPLVARAGRRRRGRHGRRRVRAAAAAAREGEDRATARRSRRATRPRASSGVIEAANRIVGKPYKYGGGHAVTRAALDRGYDCSGTVSLRAARRPLPAARRSTPARFMSWGRARPGQVDHRLRPRRPRLHGGRRPAARHQHARRGRSRALAAAARAGASRCAARAASTPATRSGY